MEFFFIFTLCISSSYFNIHWTLLSICWVQWSVFDPENMRYSFENMLILFLEYSQCRWGDRYGTKIIMQCERPSDGGESKLPSSHRPGNR